MTSEVNHFSAILGLQSIKNIESFFRSLEVNNKQCYSPFANVCVIFV